jgi:hypothetical protein
MTATGACSGKNNRPSAPRSTRQTGSFRQTVALRYPHQSPKSTGRLVLCLEKTSAIVIKTPAVAAIGIRAAPDADQAQPLELPTAGEGRRSYCFQAAVR